MRDHCGPDVNNPTPADTTVSLKVLPAPKVRKSKATKWRAAALIAVHLAIAAHILQWVYSGMRDGVRSTLSPVEPSEAMYFLRDGALNAGTVLFAAAILLTAVFGRWFCGWACHVVALQDLCTALMKRIGITPKPFRTRLVLYVPLLLALYMFVWPTFHRLALTPAFKAANISMPLWMGASPPWPGVDEHFIVEDFWATFPPWYVAVPFLLVCGFATVYFLGSKGFCTYGCPYGGFFGPADRLAIGRIVVNDRCHQCGHCTAVCTSNVRVHEEVRDFGAVVDPGCMKCLDCVSVCPNGALSFSIAKPAIFTRARVAKPAARDRLYDLTLVQDAALLAAFVVLMFCVRGAFDMVPLLMAAGLASIATFAVWKLYSIATMPNVRAQNLQLRLKGRLTATGAVFVAGALLLLAAFAWSGVVNYHLWRGQILSAELTTGARPSANKAVVLSPGYTPDPADRALALRIVGHLTLAGAPGDVGLDGAHRAGISSLGLGWARHTIPNLELAWAYAVLGDRETARDVTLRALRQQKPQNVNVAADLSMISLSRADGTNQQQVVDDTLALMDRAIADHPDAGASWTARAYVLMLAQRQGEAAESLRKAFTKGPATLPAVQLQAIQLMLPLGLADEAAKAADAALALRPRSKELRHAKALTAYGQNRIADAEALLRALIRDEPDYRPGVEFLAALLAQTGRESEAAALTPPPTTRPAR